MTFEEFLKEQGKTEEEFQVDLGEFGRQEADKLLSTSEFTDKASEEWKLGFRTGVISQIFVQVLSQFDDFKDEVGEDDSSGD